MHDFLNKTSRPDGRNPLPGGTTAYSDAALKPAESMKNEPADASDLQLLQLAAAGDDDAFHKLVDRHAKDLFRVAMSLTRNRADAEDVLQETFIGAHRSLAGFAGRSSVRTWLVQILTRQAAKAWKRNRHGRETLSLHTSEGDLERDDPMLGSDHSARSTEQRIDLMNALQAMPDVHRQVLVLREIQGMTYEEIASALGVPRGTIDSRISRARKELRQRLGLNHDGL